MNRFDKLEELREHLSDTEILDNLVSAMSDDEAAENFDYICKMFDIDLENEDEDEEDYFEECERY